MIEARADATVPTPPAEVFASATDLDGADWLPAVRGLHRLPGPAHGVGTRYAVEVGIVGRHLSGVLVCREMAAPGRAVFGLEEGLDLTITLLVEPVGSGSARIELSARYAVGGGPFGGAVERASVGAARREVGRAVEQLAARFGRAPQGNPRT